MTVTLQKHGDIGLILVDFPPVNALSHAVRVGVIEAVDALNADPSLVAGVLACEGRTFVAGADIREFDAPAKSPATRDVAASIEHSAKPIVAALHGTALGGGFELALACHKRVMALDGRVGLPEVKIGLIPGAGGTQRLPRLVGAILALEIVTSGRHVNAQEALQTGLVDSLAPDPRAAALAMAANAPSHEPLSARAVDPVDEVEFQSALSGVRRRARGQIAPLRAAEAVASSLHMSFAEGMALEASIFAELRQSAQARALRHLFLAERQASRLAEDIRPPPINSPGVVGGGTMGAGIAVALADAGLPVILVEANTAAAEAAIGRIRSIYDRQVASGRLDPDKRDERLARITTATSPEALSGADLVIEAIIENMDAKLDLFRALSSICGSKTILASNTSYLDINRMAEVVEGPERVLGLHFFSPAHVMRLLEIVRAARTAPDVLASAQMLARRLGKLAVVAGVCDGFIGNRMFARWRQQCEYLLEEGALPEQVDAAMEAYGFAMGPFAVGDLSGLDIGWANRKRRAPMRDPRERYVPIADWICEAGRFGQKTGAGWYEHPEGGRRRPSPFVTDLVLRASAERGLVRREVSAEEITRRVHAAMVNDAALILGEGVASRASDIDLVLVNGYGYPSWRGGPLHEADRIGASEMLRRVEAMCEASGFGWEPAPLLRELAASGRGFSQL
jgi:3-hydroxyacyl-CoA dehydrogenase